VGQEGGERKSRFLGVSPETKGKKEAIWQEKKEKKKKKRNRKKDIQAYAEKGDKSGAPTLNPGAGSEK